MSKKRPLDKGVNVDKQMLEHLLQHIEQRKEGVFITPKVTAGEIYPPIDAFLVSESFRKQYPFLYKKQKSDALRTQLNKCYELLKKNSTANGGPDSKDIDTIIAYYDGRYKHTPVAMTDAIPVSPAVTQTTKKQKDFFAGTKDVKVVSMSGKSPFDDDSDDDVTITQAPVVATPTPAAPASATVDSANNNLRSLYNKGAVPYDKKKPSLDDESVPLHIRRKIAYRNARIKGADHAEADKTARSLKKAPPSIVSTTSQYTLADLGGIEPILQDIRELIEYPITHPEIYQHLGVDPPRGVLLHGPPGCGKTMLAHAIAGELKVPFLKISAPEIVSGMSGESEAKIRQLFQDALNQAPCILFIDEIDAIAPKREDAQREMERRIVAQLLTSMDTLSMGKQDNEVKEDADNDDPSDQTSVSEFAMQQNDTEGAVMVNPTNQQRNKTVIVIGATNRPDAIDSALRRAGRFDREIAIGIPDDDARARILQVMCRNMRVDPSCDFQALTKKTVGYVGADLAALTRESAVIAVNRIFSELSSLDAQSKETIENTLLNKVARVSLEEINDEDEYEEDIEEEDEEDEKEEEKMDDEDDFFNQQEMVIHDKSVSKSEQKAHALMMRSQSSDHLRSMNGPLTPEQLAPLFISQCDFEEAMKKVQPAAKREGFATIPDVTWADVGALDELQSELDMAIVQPILYPKLFESIGLSVPAGVLLFGPPGCGKTLVAKAVANQSGASFLSVKGPELLNQYVGQSEAAVRQVFQRARSSAPCVIFFDELDALCPKRGNSGNQASERVVNQLLTELDGMDDRRQVFVVAATNRPDIIDPAMLRPGRLDKLLYISLPDAEGRLSILKKHARKTPLAVNVDFEVLANDPRSEGYSGADISALVREATIQALREVQTKRRQYMMNIDQHDKAAVDKANTLLDKLQIIVEQRHFLWAFGKVRASVSEESRKKYDKMHAKLTQARAHIETEKEIVDGSVVAAAEAPVPI